jgi:hypothetical protein
MPTLVVNDNSFGEGLGHLMGGLAAGNDPEKRARAMALQAQIDARNLSARNTQIQNEELLRQRKIQDEAMTTLAAQLTPDMLTRGMPQTVIPGQETLRQPFGTDFQGPLPASPVRNPQLDEVASRAPAAQAALRLAISRGGNPEQALRAAYGGLGYGQLYTAGIPQDENKARQLTGLVEGKLPSANVPMTEQQRRVMENEERSKAAALEAQRQSGAMERERLQQETNLVREREVEAGRMTRFNQGDLSIPQNSTTILSPERAAALGQRPGVPVQGQVSYGPKETVIRADGTTLRGSELADPNAPPKSPFGEGTAEDLVLRRSRVYYEQKHRAGTLTDQDLSEWIEVDAALHGGKGETRKDDKGRNVTVFTKVPRPPGTIDPRTLLPQPAVPVPGTGQTAPATGQTAGTVAKTTTADATAAGVPPAVGAQTKSRTVTDPDTGMQITTIEGEPETELATADRSNTMAQTGLIEAQANKLKTMLRGGGARKPYQPGVTEMLLGDRARIGEPGIMGTAKDMAVGGLQNLFDPEASNYQTHARGLINALTRLESGAAIGEPERRRYIDMLIPNKLDNTPEKVAVKLQLIDDIVAQRRRGMSNDEIRKWVNAKADEKEAASVSATAAPAPTGAAATPLRLPSGRPVPPGAIKGEFVLNRDTGEMEVVQ